MRKGLGEILERGEQEGVVFELAERWNRQSMRWGGEAGSADRSCSI